MSIKDLLAVYNSMYQHHFRLKQELTWEDVTGRLEYADKALLVAGKAYEGVTLNKELIKLIHSSAKHSQLSYIESRQIQKISQNIALGSLSDPELSKEKIQLEAKAKSALVNFKYYFNGKVSTASALKNILKNSTDLKDRETAWYELQKISVPLSKYAKRLRNIRNRFARNSGYNNFLDVHVEDYGLDSEGLYNWLNIELKDTDGIFDKITSCYLNFLDKKFGNVERLTSHLFTDQWSQSWKIENDKLDIVDSFFREKSSSWFIEEGARYWESIGFGSLPKSFYEKSDLYPSSDRKKLGGASMWHIDLDKDIRGLMSIEPSSYWYGAVHHELAHYYYYEAYSSEDIPPLLRIGLNRAMHEAIGDLIRLDCFQYANLKRLGVKVNSKDARELVLREAFQETFPLVRFSLGTMLSFEYDLYVNELEFDKWQEVWWSHVKKFQNVNPPSLRPSDRCDAFSKRHLTLTPGYYFNYGLSTIIKYQLHEYICRDILKEDPIEACFYGNKNVGDFLHEIMKIGGTEDWRSSYERLIGNKLSVSSLTRRFESILPL